MPEPSVPEARSESVRFGRFEVFGRLGYGGMGEVFRAIDRDGTLIALKLLRPEYAGQGHFRDMFTSEAKVSALLHHPNVVRLIDVGEVDGMMYLATELIEGASLDKILDSGSLPVGVAVHLLEELLSALHYAHMLCSEDGSPLNIVHRDVSASNVMVSLDGVVKLTDFGLAKIEGLSLTLTNEVKGKRAYMAPEQHEGAAMDRRVDLFAMGVLVHEIVVGKRPFPDVLEWMKGKKSIQGTPFDDVITKALAINPKKRYATAAELAEALSLAHPPDPQAPAYLRDRVRRTRESLRPLNKLDRLLIHELASVSPVRVQKPATVLKSAGQIEVGETRPMRAHRQSDFSDAVTVHSDGHPALLDDELPAGAPTIVTPPPMEALRGPTLITQKSNPQLSEQSDSATDASRSRGRAVTIGGVALALIVTFGLAWYYGMQHPTVTTTAAVAPPKPAPPVTIQTPPALPQPPPKADTASKTALAKLDPSSVQKPRAVSHGKATHSPPPTKVDNGSAAPGFLVLDTTPWSVVYLGGKRLGTTPLRVPLPPGKHMLSLQPKETGDRRPLPVTITSGKEQRVSLPLR